MATSVKLTQVIDIVTPPVPGQDNYTLETTYSEASPLGGKWDNEFLLIKIIVPGDDTQDVYQHVCTVADLEKYENDRAQAVINTDDYYRIETWTLSFENLEDTNAEATLQQQRTQYLVDDWEAYGGSVYPDTIYDATITNS